MSNSLSIKSKYLLGVMIVAAVVFAFAFATFATKADAACSITMTLRVGSKGAEVQCLQAALGVAADGSFGPITKAAVMAFQANNAGLAVDGVFGPMSNAVWMANVSGGGSFPAGCTSSSGYSTTTGMSCAGGSTSGLPAGCMSTSGYSPTTGAKCDGSTTGGASTGPLAGSDGTIADINTLSQYNAEEVGAGQKDVKVLGAEIEASKDGDIQINSMKVRFDSNGNNAADSDRIEDYLDSVTIWQGSTKVGSADTSDFTKESTGVYTKVVSLSGAVIRSGVTDKFYISVDAVGNLDSGDIDSDSWTIALDNVRYVDGAGVVTTETSAIPTDMDWDSAGDGISLTFASFSAASDTELKISTNSTPDSGVVKVNTSNDTDNVVLLKGKFKLEGDSDAWLDELPITLTSTGDSIDALASTITLTLGSEEFTESLGSNCATSCATQTTDVVTFNNLDYTITAGSTVNFVVKVDINDIENTGVTATDFDEGDTLLASLTTTNRAAMVVENEEGDSLTDSTERTGSATGNAQAFYSTGIQVNLVSVTNSPVNTATINDTSDNATVTFIYDVTAFGADIYVDGTVTEDGDGTYAAGQGNSYYITRADTGADAASLATDAASLTTGSGGGTTVATSASNTTWKVLDGTTSRFVLSVNVANTFTNDAANDALLFQTAIKSIGWDTSAIAATTNNYTFHLDEFKNTPVLLGELDA